jgi:hypothetical protein
VAARVNASSTMGTRNKVRDNAGIFQLLATYHFSISQGGRSGPKSRKTG